MHLMTLYYSHSFCRAVFYHVINHHITARSPCSRPIMNCFHNLPLVSFRWWRFMYFGYVRENNKQGNKTASYSMSNLLSRSLSILLSNHVSNALHYLRNGSKPCSLSKTDIEPGLDQFVVCR